MNQKETKPCPVKNQVVEARQGLQLILKKAQESIQEENYQGVARCRPIFTASYDTIVQHALSKVNGLSIEQSSQPLLFLVILLLLIRTLYLQPGNGSLRLKGLLVGCAGATLRRSVCRMT
jgi:hypothetical protein